MKKIAITLVALALLSASLSSCERIPTNMTEETTDAHIANPVVTTAPEERQPDQPPEAPVSLYEYEEVEDGIRITRYCGNETAVVIPESIDGKPVVELADTVFRNRETIESITARSVKRVDEGSFFRMESMKNLHMPMLEEVPDFALWGCNALQILEIPAVTKIGRSAFYNCSSMQTLNIPALKEVGDYAFDHCSSLQTLELPAVEQIGACAFYDCTFTELYLPNVVLLDEKGLVGSGVRSLHGKVGSYAEKWAREHFFGFVDLENDSVPEYSDEPFNRYKYDFLDTNFYKPNGVSYANNYGRCYLQIDAWDEYIYIPDEFAGWNQVAVYGDMGVLVKVTSVGEYTATRLSVVKFTRGSDSFQKYVLDLDEAIWIESVFCNFVDSQTGFMFLFYIQQSNYTFLTLKTVDGGKTWQRINCPDDPILNWREYPVVAKFISDQVGIFSQSSRGDETLYGRTYLTADGGVTWDRLHYLPDPTGLCSYGATNLVDFEYIDGVYWLEYRSYVRDELQILRYYSTDLIMWRMEGDTSEMGATNPYGITPGVLLRYSNIMKEEEQLFGKDTCHLGGDFASFTCVDLDGDGTDEVLIRALKTVVIMRKVGESVYAYSIPLEELDEADSNGVCYWHSENASGAYRLSFAGTDVQRTELYRIENEGTEQAVYWVEGQTVSDAAFQAYLLNIKGETLNWYHQFCGHPMLNQPWGGK